MNLKKNINIQKWDKEIQIYIICGRRLPAIYLTHQLDKNKCLLNTLGGLSHSGNE